MKKNQLNKWLYLTFISFIIASCSSDNSDNYPKTFVKHEFVRGNIKMFTNKGEVTDSKLIGKFIEQYGNNPYTSSQVFSVKNDEETFKIYNFELLFNSIEKGNINYINEKKPIKFNLISEDGYQNISIRDTLKSLGNKYETPIYKCIPKIISKKNLPRGTGFSYKQTYLRPLYINKSNNEIHILLVNLLKTKHNINNKLIGISSNTNLNNKINPDYISRLKKSNYRDTLVYQESYIVFKQQ